MKFQDATIPLEEKGGVSKARVFKGAALGKSLTGPGPLDEADDEPTGSSAAMPSMSAPSMKELDAGYPESNEDS